MFYVHWSFFSEKNNNFSKLIENAGDNFQQSDDVRQNFKIVNIFFYILQGAIRYELIGDYPTQSFFQLNSVTGNITTRASLKSDNLRSQSYTVCYMYIQSVQYI